jgi:hypothetical protein
MSQVENAGLPGPSIRSDPEIPALENPSAPLFTKDRVAVVKLNVPTPAIAIKAELSSIKNPPVKLWRFVVSSNSVMVKEASVNDVEPTDPVPTLV